MFVPPHDASLDDPAQPFYWQRESLVYKSELLHDPASGFGTPRCLGLVRRSEREIWLWLEDLDSSAADGWSLECFGIAAQQLGRFQGASLAPDCSETEQRWNRPIEQIMEQWAMTSAFLLEQAQQARNWQGF